MKVNPYKPPSQLAVADPKVVTLEHRGHKIEVTGEYLPRYLPLIPRYRVLASGQETHSTLVLSNRFVFSVIDNGKEIPLMFESRRDAFRTSEFHIYSQDGLVAESAVVMNRWLAKQLITFTNLAFVTVALIVVVIVMGDS